jgi:hypothetical protein
VRGQGEACRCSIRWRLQRGPMSAQQLWPYSLAIPRNMGQRGVDTSPKQEEARCVRRGNRSPRGPGGVHMRTVLLRDILSITASADPGRRQPGLGATPDYTCDQRAGECGQSVVGLAEARLWRSHAMNEGRATSERGRCHAETARRGTPQINQELHGAARYQTSKCGLLCGEVLASAHHFAGRKVPCLQSSTAK